MSADENKRLVRQDLEPGRQFAELVEAERARLDRGSALS
jgi:hypothetical protein